MQAIMNLPLIVKIIAILAGFNLSLSGIKAGLDMIQDKTATQLDNKVDSALGKAIAFIGKILDIVGYNPPHP